MSYFTYFWYCVLCSLFQFSVWHIENKIRQLRQLKNIQFIFIINLFTITRPIISFLMYCSFSSFPEKLSFSIIGNFYIFYTYKKNSEKLLLIAWTLWRIFHDSFFYLQNYNNDNFLWAPSETWVHFSIVSIWLEIDILMHLENLSVNFTWSQK